MTIEDKIIEAMGGVSDLKALPHDRWEWTSPEGECVLQKWSGGWRIWVPLDTEQEGERWKWIQDKTLDDLLERVDQGGSWEIGDESPWMDLWVIQIMIPGSEPRLAMWLTRQEAVDAIKEAISPEGDVYYDLWGAVVCQDGAGSEGRMMHFQTGRV